MCHPPSNISQNESPTTLGVILSGGASLRFGGEDKGLQLYRNKPLIQWVIDSISPQVSELVICINRNKPKYIEFSHKTLSDLSGNYQGPMSGIATSIDYCRTLKKQPPYDQLLISSCDTPLLPQNYLLKLNTSLLTSKLLVAVVNDGKRNQNLHCLINRNAWQSLLDFYADGGRAMHKWYKEIGVLEVDFSEQSDDFLNINCADQLN